MKPCTNPVRHTSLVVTDDIRFRQPTRSERGLETGTKAPCQGVLSAQLQTEVSFRSAGLSSPCCARPRDAPDRGRAERAPAPGTARRPEPG